MDWMSFLIGALAGLLLGWLIGLLFLRPRGRPADRETDILRVRLEQAEIRMRQLQANKKEWDGCQQRLLEAEATIESLEARLLEADVRLEGARAEISTLTAGLDTDRGKAVEYPTAELFEADTASATPPVQRDSLQRIEGIGPKISLLLKQAEIYTYAQLADATAEHLEGILRKAGPDYRLASPETWPQQARLAADGDWQALEKLQGELIRGRIPRPPG
jgi:predicted flap endonuclease-1-like 5' DNA nuclease